MSLVQRLKVPGIPEFPNAVHQLVRTEMDFERNEIRATFRVWASAAIRLAGEPPISHINVTLRADQHPQARVLLGLEDAPASAPRNRKDAIYQAVMTHPDMAGSRREEYLEGTLTP